MRHYCLGGCSVPSVCARRSRPVRGGSGRYLVLCPPFFPLPAPRVPRCVWRAVPSWCPLSSLAGTPFHAVGAFRARSGCPSGGPRVSFSCVCARALAVSAPRWVVWRAHFAWSRHWALVGPFHVVRAPPRVLPRSRAPSGVLGGGRSGPGSPLLGLGLWGRRPGVPGAAAVTNILDLGKSPCKSSASHSSTSESQARKQASRKQGPPRKEGSK